jgi:predicted deacylase
MSRKSFDPFNVGKNEKAFGYVNIVDNVSARFNMPVGVVNGASDGPTLVVTGGLYPTEYCGVESASRLYQLVNPQDLSGRFITIPVINMHSFQFRAPMNLISTGMTPLDRGFINNSFPGLPNGRPTEVLAYKVFNILSKADYHVDFRGGDLPESHLVHTIYLKMGSEIDEIAETMAKVFGFEYVLPGTPDISHTSPGTMIYEATKAGCASIISESGLGYREQPLEEFIQLHIDGTMNLMKYFGMIMGEPSKPENQRFLNMTWHRVTAPTPGVFVALADYGDILEKGQVIGLMKDLDGSVSEEITSPINGVVHTMFPRRVVHVRDPLYTLLEIAEPTGWS